MMNPEVYSSTVFDPSLSNISSSNSLNVVSEDINIASSLNTHSSLDSQFNSEFTNEEIDLIAQALSAQATSVYTSTSGYGLVNAAAAVARAVGQPTFANVPNLGGNNWGADLIKAPEAWARGYTGQGVVVAVLDTGVDRNHSDLSSNIWMNTREIAGNGRDDDGNGYVDDVYGWNFANNNSNTLDVHGHGTHVSGTIGGVRNNFGVTGIAYNSKIMPVKVLDDNGSGSHTGIAQGIRYAADNGAKVINMSLVGTVGSSTLQSAVQYASSKGAIVVMAAGNSGGTQPLFPASYATNWGIAVGAVNSTNTMASFSNRAGSNSSMVYVTAPGVSVLSTLPNNRYASWNGTSMASPHVAGVVALMTSANRNLTDAQVRQILRETSGNSLAATTNFNSMGSSNTLALASINDSEVSYSSISSENTFVQYENHVPTETFTQVSYSNTDPLINSGKQEEVDDLLNSFSRDLNNDLSTLGVDLNSYVAGMQALNQIAQG
ncbi:peptidase S8 and S53 subtilisin kexin sedolisin [Gloeothece citriformis PCC 7424]|uniref:Peptidase S8 and S53 subtilisin kexin sedolisin n=1 Tax=Gloeothece citriformis (strain PCC 7424) TaxID=65393 RepID=B7KEJ0_GLOC7|nr:S8 family peptidase [Gloeothece citriformis]ACK69015.1 peptidase S8 and S53 subtilisin kexin sedolisin [Gloeothece citriformis PCC 7424]